MLFAFCGSQVFAQAKLGDFIHKSKNNVNNVKNKVDKVDNTAEKTGIDPGQDTTRKQTNTTKDEDKKKTDNLAIGDDGDEDKKKDNKTKQTKEFIKDSKTPNSGTTPPPGGGSLVNPDSQKKNIAIGDEGAEDDKVKNKEKSNSTQNNSVTPK